MTQTTMTTPSLGDKIVKAVLKNQIKYHLRGATILFCNNPPDGIPLNDWLDFLGTEECFDILSESFKGFIKEIQNKD